MLERSFALIFVYLFINLLLLLCLIFFYCTIICNLLYYLSVTVILNNCPNCSLNLVIYLGVGYHHHDSYAL